MADCTHRPTEPHVATNSSGGGNGPVIQKQRHRKLKELMKTLERKMQGYWNYYGVIGNSKRLSQISRLLYKWLNHGLTLYSNQEDRMSPKTAKKDDSEDNENRAAPKAATETVKLTNRTRRPISFRVTGRTIRLGPGEMSAALEEHCVRQPEVRALCAKGVLGASMSSKTTEPRLQEKALKRKGQPGEKESTREEEPE
jgi:hypothetical protein